MKTGPPAGPAHRYWYDGGAGIFVFPGLAARQAGPGTALSFAIGAGIALLVAVPTSDLATAMPESGGGYYLVSRGLSTLPGAMVGIGQWMGRIVASAFYLMGDSQPATHDVLFGATPERTASAVSVPALAMSGRAEGESASG